MSRGKTFLIDLVCVFAFVLIGKRSHQSGSSLAAFANTAVPFLVALAASWVIGRRSWDKSSTAAFGALIWFGTVVGGLLMRRALFNNGIAAPFIIVATIFFALTFIGRRAILSSLQKRR
jgi:hypothetical protein